MKRTFITLAAIAFLVWSGSNLWLAGYEQGYEQGESMAWTRANSSFASLSRYNMDNARITLKLKESGELQAEVPEVIER